MIRKFETRFFNISLVGCNHCVDHLDQIDL